MKEVFVSNSINYLIKNNACQEKDIKIFRYTLESIYSFFTKTSVVLLLSVLFGTFKITIFILLFYCLLRGFSFGIHATKNVYCWITTLGIYIISSLFIKFLSIPNFYIYIVYLLSFFFILLWAPADTPARPLLSKKKRTVNKMIALCLFSFYIVLALFLKNPNFNEIIAFVLLIQSICICPLTYKIFHIPYNNYKSYKK